jgi:hypothetical protein
MASTARISLAFSTLFFHSKSYEVGDVIRFGRTYAKLGIETGGYLTVNDLDLSRGVVSLTRKGTTIAWEPRRAPNVEVYREENRAVMPGDRLRWTRNDRDLGRRNGEVVQVLLVDPARRVAMVQESRGAELLDLSAKQHWEHAYASTIHAAQGKTTDRVLVHIDTKYEQTMGSESFYVAISRARHEAKLYVDDRSKLAVAVERSAQKQYGLEAVERAVSVPTGRDTRGDMRG